MSRARWAVFLSGRGSNAEALWEHLAEMDIRLCVSSRKNAYGLLRAQRSGIPTLRLDPKPNWTQLTTELRARNINRIFLLGFMKILPSDFVSAWEGQIWNLHPSLLPAFPGAHAIDESYQAGSSMGVSVHEVIAEMDAGPLFLQSPILDSAKSGKHIEELSSVQMKISVCEQRLVREAALRKNTYSHIQLKGAP